jgi:hypothetical protein
MHVEHVKPLVGKGFELAGGELTAVVASAMIGICDTV